MAGNGWDDYRVVLALARRGSVAAAARELGVDATTVARRLERVERVLGARLFDRARGRAVPTAAAAAVLRRLERAERELDAMAEEAGGADRRVAGRVRVTAVAWIANRVLVPRLASLLAEHEGLEVELVVDSAVLDVARARDADVAVRGARPDTDPAAVTTKLGDVPHGVWCRRDLVGRDPPPGWIGYTHRSLGRPLSGWIDARLDAGERSARARGNDAETLLHALRAGLGRSLFPDALGRRFAELARIDPGVEVPARELWLVMHPSWREVRRIEVVATWVAASVRAFLQEG